LKSGDADGLLMSVVAKERVWRFDTSWKGGGIGEWRDWDDDRASVLIGSTPPDNEDTSSDSEDPSAYPHTLLHVCSLIDLQAVYQ
jgi:hypothetical protein